MSAYSIDNGADEQVICFPDDLYWNLKFMKAWAVVQNMLPEIQTRSRTNDVTDICEVTMHHVPKTKEDRHNLVKFILDEMNN